MDNGRRGALRVVTIVLLALAAALVWVMLTTMWLWRNQERVVFQPPTVDADGPAPARRVEFKASDGHEVFGYLVSPAAQQPPYASGTRALDTRASAHAGLDSHPPTAVVIAFHGNADLAAWLVPWAREVVERTGAAVFLPEYRGYAGIAGIPSYETAAADARGALQYVRETLRPSHLVLFGHSLGTAIAADMAAFMLPEAPSALVLQSPFTSAREMAARMLVPPIPWLWRRISRVHYDTRTIVANLDAPVWVAHGTRDVVVPVRMGRQVFQAARRPGELLILEGAGHNDVADMGGERYWKWLAAAVDGRKGER